MDPLAGASGGLIVYNVGAWNDPGGPGTVRFNSVIIPASGAYKITIFYVHPNGETNRKATIAVSGIAPIEVDFVGNATCCQTKSVNVTVAAGEHTITISHATEHAPAIDKIVISRP